LERRKDMMIAALWANSGIEGKERTPAIETIERNFEEAVLQVHSSTEHEEEASVYDENNPFLAAAKRGVAKLDKPTAPTNGTVKEVIDYTEGIDQ
jgi:hypothetical protein